jgi:hypothetical protein
VFLSGETDFSNLRLIRLMRCNRVCYPNLSGEEEHWISSLQLFSDRTFLQPSAYELHTHLAHALVRYLGLSSPEEMAGYGLTSVADLVDLISRVSRYTRPIFEMPNYHVVHHQRHRIGNALLDGYRHLRFTFYCIVESFLRP